MVCVLAAALSASSSFLFAARELENKIMYRVNGVNVTYKDTKTPHIANNGKPFSDSDYITFLSWLREAKEHEAKAPEGAVERTIARYEEDNDMANLPSAQKDRLLEGTIGIDFATYAKQLEDYYTIESYKNYQFLSRCSVGEVEIENYYHAHPVKVSAEYKIDLASLTSQQASQFNAGTLDKSSLEWDSFEALKEEDIASHLRLVTSLADGDFALAKDAQGEPLLVRLVEKKPAHIQSLSERYHAIEMQLQREKVARYTEDIGRDFATAAVVVYPQ